MSASFEDLNLDPATLDALLAEGFEIASEFQEEIIPVVARGNNVVGRAGPGAGVLLAYAAPLLDRVEPAGGELRVVVLVPTRSRATELAERTSRLAARTGHVVAALGGTWAVPERADMLFGTPADLRSSVESSTVKLSGVQALVVDGGAQIQEIEGLDAVETIAGFVPSEAQKVLFSLPLTEALETFVEGHLKRPVHVPPRPRSDPEDEPVAPHRGTLFYHLLGGDRLDAALSVVSGMLVDDGARHVLIHFHSDDEAADVGDSLTLRGYAAGAPGDASVPIWLGTDALASRRVLDDLEDPDGVATLSYRVPLDADALDQRHGRGGARGTLLRGSELSHLEEVARVAGYRLDARPDTSTSDLSAEASDFRARIEKALQTTDLAAYLLLLEPLIEREGAARVAAAAAALLRRRGPDSDVKGPGEGARPGARTGDGAPTAWVRLFVSLGSRDDAGPGDILGAITGEAQVEGSRVGRIDIQDTFSIVEVDERVAEAIIRAMNGITVKGRSLRVDYSRTRGEKRRGRAR